MATPRVGILPQEERMAIFRGAKRLGLDPYEFGAFLSLESGPNMDPNIVGGAGGRHKGLIQFGQNEQRQYGISGTQTRAGQMPAVLQYFEDRGYKPGMGIARAYATVLGGNPNVSLTSQDSFGTSVQSVLPRLKKGGDYYANAQRVLGDIPSGAGATAPPSTPKRMQKANSLLDAAMLSVIEDAIRNVTNVPTVRNLTNVPTVPSAFDAGGFRPLTTLF